MTTRTAWCAKCDEPVLCDERGCIACRVEKQEQDRATRTNKPIGLAAFCAICVDGTIGLRAAQLDLGGPVFTICQGCDEHRQTKGFHGISAPRGPNITRYWC